MIEKFYNIFNYYNELTLDGYCEFDVANVYDPDASLTKADKLYIFYITTDKGRIEFVFSDTLVDLIDVYEVDKYDKPEEFINFFSSLNFINSKYFITNNCDYLERKIIKLTVNNNVAYFDLSDFIISWDMNKLINSINFFVKSHKTQPCKLELDFQNAVVFNKRIAVPVGSLEEKLYHLEDVSSKEKEAFYKNKKESSGYKPALRVR